MRKIVVLFFSIFSFIFSEELILGFYSFSKKDYMDKVSGSFLNLLMPYGLEGKEEKDIEEYLNYALSKDVKIIFSVKDCYKTSKWYPKVNWANTDKPEEYVAKIAERFGKHPAVFGWYIADEPTWSVGIGNKNQIKLNCDSIRKFSDKPIIVCEVPGMKLYDDLSKWCDILAPDIYPVPGGKILKVYEDINELKKKYKNSKIWAVLQVHGAYQYNKEYDEITGRPPTYEEIKAMSYLALIGGAEGILYYSIFDLLKQNDGEKKLEFLKELAEELKKSYKIIASKDSKIKIEEVKKERVIYIVKNYQNENYIICVNIAGIPNEFKFKVKDGLKEIKFNPYEVKIENIKY